MTSRTAKSIRGPRELDRPSIANCACASDAGGCQAMGSTPMAWHPPASDAQAQFAMLGRSSSLGPRIDFAVLDVMIPSTPIYTPPLYLVSSSHRTCQPFRLRWLL